MDKKDLTDQFLPELSTKTGQLVGAAVSYLQAATSQNTRKAYQQDIKHFVTWGGLLPTSPKQVIEYLHDHAGQLNARTLARRLTALKNWHLYQGFSDPTSFPAVRKTLTGIKNIHGKPKQKASPIGLSLLRDWIIQHSSSCQLKHKRNKALLLIGFFGAFRRSELVNIRWEDIVFSAEGIEILISKSKSDQQAHGQVCAIPYGAAELCPIAALNEWCEKAGIQSGFIFRRIQKNNRISKDPISAQQANIIIKVAFNTTRDGMAYSSHSLRRGFATQASKMGVPFGAIMRQGRWKHEGTVLGYIEEGKRFDNNAATLMFEKLEKKTKK